MKKKTKPLGPVIFDRRSIKRASMGIVCGFDWSTVPPGEKYWAGVMKRLDKLADLKP